METMQEERKFLENLTKQCGGILWVDDVLNAAQDPACILHKHFQWDDSKAAESFRRMQARQLIQKCTVTIEKAPDVPIRAFVSMVSDQHSGGGYRIMADVLSNDALRQELIHDMTVSLNKWKKQISLLEQDYPEIITVLEGVIRTLKETSHVNVTA